MKQKDVQVGMVLKRTNYSHGKMEIGDTGIVQKVGNDGVRINDSWHDPENLELANPPKSPTGTLTDLTETKIWIGDNKELRKKIRDKATQLGWDAESSTFDNAYALYFYRRDTGTKYAGASDRYREKSSNFKEHVNKEIFPIDLGIIPDGLTTAQVDPEVLIQMIINDLKPTQDEKPQTIDSSADPNIWDDSV